MNERLIVEERRQRIFALINRGITSKHELARTLGVSERTIDRDLGNVHARMVAEASRTASKVYIGRQLSRIEHLIKENSLAWENSKKPAEIMVTREITNPDGSKSFLTERRIEPQTGNPAYLREVRELLKREADLLALDALPASQKRVNDLETAKGIMELMRLVEIDAESEIITGPIASEPMIALPSPEDDEEGVVLDLSADFGRSSNGNGRTDH